MKRDDSLWKAILEDEKDRILEERLRYLTHQPPTTMGIGEFVLARAERIGLEKGLKRGT